MSPHRTLRRKINLNAARRVSPIFGALALVGLFTVGPMASFSRAESDPDPDATAARADREYLELDLVGTWRFQYDDVRRAIVETSLAEHVPAAELPAAKRSAEREAKSSTLEITFDHELVSSVLGKEIDRAKLVVQRSDANTIAWVREDAPDAEPIVATLVDSETLVLSDPVKGSLTFTRER